MLAERGEKSMGDGKHCPACGTDIGVWPIFSAALLKLIRCPRCKARIAYQEIGAVLAILLSIRLLVWGIVVAAAFYLAWGPFESKLSRLGFIALVLGAWILVELPVEIFIAWYLRANKVLEIRSGGTPR
jgi:hypothetical protein